MMPLYLANTGEENIIMRVFCNTPPFLAPDDA